MFIVEIEYISSLGTAEEIDDYILCSLPPACPDHDRLEVIAVKSNNDDFSRIKQKIINTFGTRFGFLMLGTMIYGVDEVRLIYHLLAIVRKKPNLVLWPLIKNEEVSIADNDYYTSNAFKVISGNLALVTKASSTYEIVEFGYLIGYLRDALKSLPTSILKSALVKATVNAITLLNSEKAFLFGNEARTISAAISANYYNEFVNSTIYDISALYGSAIKAQSVVTPELRDEIQKRISYLNYGRVYSSKFRSENNITSRPGAMVWFSLYFIILADHYNSRNKFTAAIALCIRSLELYCQSVLIFIRKGELGTDGNFRLFVSSKTGVMEYWSQISSFVPTLTTEHKSNITNSILFRNKSIFAHGIHHASHDISKKIFDDLVEVYTVVEKYVNPSNNYWEGLSKYMKVNLCKHLGQNVAANTLSYCRIEHQLDSSS